MEFRLGIQVPLRAIMNTREAYLALHLLDQVGPIRLRRLIEVFGCPQAVLKAPIQSLTRVHGLGPETAQIIADWENRVDLGGELERIRAWPCEWITQEDAQYPPSLREIYDPPAGLYVRGTLHPQDHLGIAVVGSRRASAYGLESARRLCIQLARAQVTVVSGGARGIDTVAHRGAMVAKGRTVAVLGSGLDHLYPAENSGLFDCIADQGALITPFPFGYRASRHSFPSRNRIVAGMSLGTVVVEAGRSSGALITAHQALDYGRLVFAVPGRIDALTSRGCHALIKQGAKLIEQCEDVLSEFEYLHPAKVLPEVTQPTISQPATLEPDETQLLEKLQGQELSVECLINQTGLPASRVSTLMMGLEMKQWVRRLPGHRYQRTEPPV
jgi:DNA processing protein